MAAGPGNPALTAAVRVTSHSHWADLAGGRYRHGYRGPAQLQSGFRCLSFRVDSLTFKVDLGVPGMLNHVILEFADVICNW